ncbi:CIS tube protein [Flavobacterium sp. RHBU_3]|uniref:CIS tube protein n=1 Tax=Flavobacterium sp. RHBU_3 TaxID=3391184 RepID=UPI003984D775
MVGPLKKLKISTYKDNTYKATSLISETAFEVFINPTSYSMTYKTKFSEMQANGTPNVSAGFVASPPTDLQLEFLFDGTGVTQENSGNKLVNSIAEKLSNKKAFAIKKVETQISDFYKATGKMDGKIHKPYEVVITWGTLEFKGTLSEFTLDYKLFDNEGNPLRAIGKAKFTESLSEELMNKTVKKESPDLTHKRIVKASDTLPMMCQNIYGDPKYYLEVAKVNGLVNFRQLTPGQEIYFPPVAKTS